MDMEKSTGSQQTTTTATFAELRKLPVGTQATCPVRVWYKGSEQDDYWHAKDIKGDRMEVRFALAVEHQRPPLLVRGNCLLLHGTVSRLYLDKFLFIATAALPLDEGETRRSLERISVHRRPYDFTLTACAALSCKNRLDYPEQRPI